MKQWLVGENVEKNKKREEMNKKGRKREQGNKEQWRNLSQNNIRLSN